MSPFQGGMRQQPRVRERVVEPRTAQRTEDRDSTRAAPDGREECQLEIGFVLGRLGQLERNPAGPDLGDPGFAERVAVADHEVGPEAGPRGLARPAIGCDDDVRTRGPAGPGSVELGARGHLAVAESQPNLTFFMVMLLLTALFGVAMVRTGQVRSWSAAREDQPDPSWVDPRWRRGVDQRR